MTSLSSHDMWSPADTWSENPGRDTDSGIGVGDVAGVRTFDGDVDELRTMVCGHGATGMTRPNARLVIDAKTVDVLSDVGADGPTCNDPAPTKPVLRIKPEP